MPGVERWGIDFGWKKCCAAVVRNGWRRVYAMVVEEAWHEDEILKAHYDFWKTIIEEHLTLPAFFVYELPVPRVGSVAYRRVCMAQGVWASLIPPGCGYIGLYPSELKKQLGCQDRDSLRKKYGSKRLSIVLYSYAVNGRMQKRIYTGARTKEAIRKHRLTNDIVDAVIAAEVARVLNNLPRNTHLTYL